MAKADREAKKAQQQAATEEQLAKAEADAKADAAKDEQPAAEAKAEGVQQLPPGAGMKEADAQQTQGSHKIVNYVCDSCGRTFESHRVRQGEKLCADCIGLRRALKGIQNRGLTSTEVIARAAKLMKVDIAIEPEKEAVEA
jgi:formylmethanofuran dehydrogenase subunit E